MNFLWSAAVLLPLLWAQQNRPLAAQAQPAQAFMPSYEAIRLRIPLIHRSLQHPRKHIMIHIRSARD